MFQSHLKTFIEYIILELYYFFSIHYLKRIFYS